MVDDVIASAAEVSTSQMPVEPIKKQRAPRRSKAEIVADKAASSVQTAKGSSRKRGVATAEKLPVAEAPVTGRRGRQIKAKVMPEAKSGRAGPEAPAPASNEFADLIQLEEENKQLRKALADKLRAENADLRKRLGV
ncbi:hypothetical protein [Rhizobium brockwellii]|uniref:hypothetical protein n=1 Tax=Rhizobium TaxID=379 RepID=UPI003F99EA21